MDDREDAPDYYVDYISKRLPIGQMPPERYVALDAHNWMLAGPLVYRYPDPKVDAYVRRVYELLNDYARLDDLRREWLTPAEHAEIAAKIEAMQRPDYEY